MRAFNPTIAWLCLLLNLAAISAPARGIDLRADLVGLVNSEVAFSRAAMDKGMHAAFLSFLATRSIVFRPQPVDGRSYYYNVPDSGRLSWYPIVADISRTADLGYTTGPYEFRSNSGKAQSAQQGDYVSLWSRQADDTWKVTLDIGTENPAPETKPMPWQPPSSYRPVSDQPPANAKTPPDVLMELDRRCTAVAKTKGAAAAYSSFLADEARLHLPGMLPVLGKPQILALVSQKEASDWQPLGADLARGADLGYTYGKRPNPAGSGDQYYVRIWKRVQAGKLKVVLEVVTSPERIQKEN